MDKNERARHAQRAINAYHRVFNADDGKTILADLAAAFGADMPAFIPQTRGAFFAYDPHHAAIRDGQRMVILHIQAALRKTPKSDGEAMPPTIKT